MAGRLNSTVDIDLDDEGERQAAELGRELGRLGSPPVVRSPALRTRRTAAPLEATTGRPATVDERLREVAFGAFEGRTMADLADDERFGRWRRGATTPDTDAEALPVAARRAAASLADLTDEHRDEPTVVVIGHGVLLRALLCVSVLGLEATAYRRLRLDNAHGAIVVPSPEGSGHRLAACNVPASALSGLLRR